AMALLVPALILAFVAGVAAYATKISGFSVLAWIFGLAAACTYIVLMNGRLFIIEDFVLLGACVFITLLLTITAVRVGAALDGMFLVSGTILWLLFSWLVFLILTIPVIIMKQSA